MRHKAVILTELIILGALILNNGGGAKSGFTKEKYISEVLDKYCAPILHLAGEMYMPAAVYAMPGEKDSGKEMIKNGAFFWLPLIKYSDQKAAKNVKTAVRPQTETKEQIRQIRKEAKIDKDEPLKEENANHLEGAQTVPSCVFADKDALLQRLRDFNYLISNYYTVDSSTTTGPAQLNADDLLAKDMRIDLDTPGPKVLIFHTHSQEAFVDSVRGDPSTSIVGMGQYLCELLNEKGIETLHDCGVYDIIDGKLDRSSAYEQAEYYIRPLLKQNPSIEVVIDLHRDGVPETMHLVTQINGKPTAKVMYFNGLSKTRENGDIDYLYNPYIQDNLAFSLQMKLTSDELFPDFARRIYLRAYRYNLHLRPKSLLIEAGAQTNTVEEMRNSMEVLSVVLKRVLTGQIIS